VNAETARLEVSRATSTTRKGCWRVDWGYFQINTVHLKLAGVSLRDLLDCSANIDCA